VGEAAAFTASVSSSSGVTPNGTVSFNERGTTLGRANARHDIAQLAGQVKVGKVKIRNCAFKHDDAKSLACVHSREQILEALKRRAVHDVERRVIKNDPPVGGRFLDDPQW